MGTHTVADGNVFLGGTYVQVGVSADGSTGAGPVPAGFVNPGGLLGFIADLDGFGVGAPPAMSDVTMSTDFEDRISLGYVSPTSGTVTASHATYRYDTGTFTTSTVDISSGTTLGARTTGTMGALAFQQDITFDDNDPFFITTVTLTNNSTEALSDVRFMRSFYANQYYNIPGIHSTVNDILMQGGAGSVALLETYSPEGGTPVFLASDDSRARVSIFGYAVRNPYDPRAWDAPVDQYYSDYSNVLTFREAALAPGDSVTFSFVTGFDATNLGGLDIPPLVRSDILRTIETTAIDANVFADNGYGADIDFNGDPFSVIAVNGSAAAVGTTITLPSGALLALSADGTAHYDPNHAYDYLPAPGSGSYSSATDVFTYTVTGGFSATVYVDVTGVDSNDVLTGFSGAGDIADRLIAGIGDDLVRPFGGNDTVFGGEGNDTVIGGPGDDSIDGGAGNDVLRGNDDSDWISGRNGDDTLSGGNGNDTLIGGNGRDILLGDAGNDTFVYLALTDSHVGARRDMIDSFAPGEDRIDLAALDAIASGGDDPFHFIADAAFSHAAGELRAILRGPNTYISGDVDGDGKADFEIGIRGHVTLHETDFVL